MRNKKEIFSTINEFNGKKSQIPYEKHLQTTKHILFKFYEKCDPDLIKKDTCICILLSNLKITIGKSKRKDEVSDRECEIDYCVKLLIEKLFIYLENNLKNRLSNRVKLSNSLQSYFNKTELFNLFGITLEKLIESSENINKYEQEIIKNKLKSSELLSKTIKKYYIEYRESDDFWSDCYSMFKKNGFQLLNVLNISRQLILYSLELQDKYHQFSHRKDKHSKIFEDRMMKFVLSNYKMYENVEIFEKRLDKETLNYLNTVFDNLGYLQSNTREINVEEKMNCEDDNKMNQDVTVDSSLKNSNEDNKCIENYNEIITLVDKFSQEVLSDYIEWTKNNISILHSPESNYKENNSNSNINPDSFIDISRIENQYNYNKDEDNNIEMDLTSKIPISNNISNISTEINNFIEKDEFKNLFLKLNQDLREQTIIYLETKKEDYKNYLILDGKSAKEGLDLTDYYINPK